MADFKKRLSRAEKRISPADEIPRTYAGFVKWETERRAANGGELSPADRDRIGAAWSAFITQAPRAGRV